MAYQEGKKSGGGFESSERIDPVCGMTVKKDSPHKLEHEGKEYFFCSRECRDKFSKEPMRYAA